MWRRLGSNGTQNTLKQYVLSDASSVLSEVVVGVLLRKRIAIQRAIG